MTPTERVELLRRAASVLSAIHTTLPGELLALALELLGEGGATKPDEVCGRCGLLRPCPCEDEGRGEPAKGEVASGNVWFCKIGPAPSAIPSGGDWPMRQAVQHAFNEMFGQGAQAVFSGWGGHFTEPEQAVIENRMPRPPASPSPAQPGCTSTRSGLCLEHGTDHAAQPEAQGPPTGYVDRTIRMPKGLEDELLDAAARKVEAQGAVAWCWHNSDGDCLAHTHKARTAERWPAYAETAALYAHPAPDPGLAEAVANHVCGHCGHVISEGRGCGACASLRAARLRGQR